MTLETAPNVKELDQPASSASDEAAEDQNRRPADSYPHTDVGNAERLLDRFGRDICYSKSFGFCVWIDKRWQTQQDLAVRDMVVWVSREMKREAEHMKDEKRAGNLRKWASTSQASPRIFGALEVAKAVCVGRGKFVQNFTATFDADPWLLNAENGTLDLRTGKLESHRRENRITKLCPVKYDRHAKSPIWYAFLDRLFQDCADTSLFLQRSVGYGLTGMTSEQCLWFLYGIGANGKSTFVNAIEHVMGDYGDRTDISTLMTSQRSGIPNDIAKLRGARFVAATETEEGKHLAEVLVKQLTGGDSMSARFLRQEYFTFKPECKIFISGNHKPTIRGTDDGIWRRLHLVPFSQVIPPKERDRHLGEKLKAEAAGILAWMVRGCLDWQDHGLAPPRIVVDATAEYRRDMDLLGAWLDECCDLGDGLECAGGDLYECYAMYSKENGQRALSNQRFARQLLDRRLGRSRDTGVSIWQGVALNRDADQRLMVWRQKGRK